MKISWRDHASAAMAAALAMLAVTAWAVPARAHPADMYAQSFALKLYPTEMQFVWQILPGPFLADAVWAAADLDQNGEISEDEGLTWIEPFIDGLTVRVGGKELANDAARDLHWPSTVEVVRTGEDRIQFLLVFPIPQAGSDPLAVEIHASYLEANSLNWFSAEAEGGLSFAEPIQKNGLLQLSVSVRGSTLADGRSTWNSGIPNIPALSAVLPQGGRPSGGGTNEAAISTTPGGATDMLTGIVKTQEISPSFLAGALILSLVLGSLHALTPGHGKALVGAYLVGSQGRTRDAVFLGGIVTLTHTGSVVMLGLVTLLASHYILPALIAPWLEIISGVLVIGFGLNLLIRRGGLLQSKSSAAGGHDHEGHHAHGHEHGHAHGDTHSHPHVHSHDGMEALHGQPRTEHTIGSAASRVTTRSLLALGISGGLVPCPDAIAILLVAVAVNRIPFGVLLILSFSVGLALVLIGIGIAMVNGARLITRSAALARFAVYAPVISALVVTGLGGALTYSAVKSLQFGSSVVQSAGASESGADRASSRSMLLYIAADAAGRDQLFAKHSDGGTPVQCTSEESGITGYVVSPDGAAIVYTTFKLQGGTAIWAIDAQGGNRRLVLDCPRAECNSPQWYPDNRKLAYERLDDISDPLVPRFSIWWLDYGTGATEPMFQDSALASYSPRFSPDGKWLSYLSSADNTLILFNLQSGASRSLPLGTQSVLPGSWGPNSDLILFGSQLAGGPLQMRVYALESGEITSLGGPAGAADYYGVWSPAGDWIAIDRSVPVAPGENSNQVWLVRPDGSDARALLQEPEASYSSLAWAPDGASLLYARYVLDVTSPTPGRFDIYRVDVKSGQTQLLIEGGDMPNLIP